MVSLDKQTFLYLTPYGNVDDEENDDDYDDDGEGDDEGQQNDPGNQSSNNGGTPDGTVTEKYNDEDAQKIIDEIDGDIYKQDKDFGTIDADDDLEFDQDNSATHPVPKVDKATKACKTVFGCGGGGGGTVIAMTRLD